MTVRISELHAVEILDSRARPTLAVTLTTGDGARIRAGVPSGASTGTREAVELRDGDRTRYGGQGVSTAVGHVNAEISRALTGRDFASAADIDQALIELDGTRTKSRLGANAVIGVSLAVWRAEAAAAGQPLWRHLAEVAG
ncbi:phosphopyruvate hydratase, partial [Streptomyces sp. SID6139]|nr:phosphopyruvate hydratase [Streptomyces sp. SID6139]